VCISTWQLSVQDITKYTCKQYSQKSVSSCSHSLVQLASLKQHQ